MTILLEFTVPSDEFPIGRAFASLEEARVELERVVPTGNGPMPYVWVTGTTPERISERVEPIDGVTAIALLDDLGDRGLLCRVMWDESTDSLVSLIAEEGVTILSARSAGEVWRFRVRIDDHDGVRDFTSACDRCGVQIDVVRLQPFALDDEPRLSRAQYEALALAFEMGHFDDPRRATLDDVATELDITRQSVAGRLRRGQRNLLGWLFAGEEFAGDRNSGRSNTGG